jgi:dipeptidyl aminopeptidase/acylaminoacyl peptidase
MYKTLCAALWSVAGLLCQAQTPGLTVEKIMRDPKWIGTSPSSVCWNYSGKSILFNWNPTHGKSDSVYEYSLAGGQIRKLGYLDALRQRAIHEGAYNRQRTRIVYSFQGDIYLLDPATGKTIRITRTEEEEGEPGFTKNDEWISYRNGNNLYAWDIREGSTIQLTNLLNGEPPVMAKPPDQEVWLENQQLQTSEVIRDRKGKREARKEYLEALRKDTLRKIYIGSRKLADLVISPDARFVTYAIADELPAAKKTVVPNYVTETGFTAEIPSRPKVGMPRGKISYYIFDRVRDTVIKIATDSIPGIRELPDYLKEYPAKVAETAREGRSISEFFLKWNEDGTAAAADIRSKDQKDRWLMQLDPLSGKLRLLDRQHDEAWIGGPGIGWESRSAWGWADNHTIYFQSEATGYSHLYLYNLQNNTGRTLTQGKYEISGLELSPDKRYFYFLSNEEHPGKRQIYRMRTDGTAKERITDLVGGYQFFISPDASKLAYLYSYQTKPWELYLQEPVPGKNPVQVTDQAMSTEWKSYPWRDTKIFYFPARDGKQVYARIYEPAKGKKNNAAVLFVHGAGYLQNVNFQWSYYFREAMFNNLLSDLGYTVMDIDYRASEGYGRDWRTAIYRFMGGKDLDDNVDAASWLVRNEGIDSTRIGMYGGSYGGFMTLMALFTQPGVFKAGAALRPVTDWAHYNDGYTGAILNFPFTDSLAYWRSSPINFAGGLRHHLLICHGMVDTNVHFQDAVRLNQRLIELGKENWDMAVYPVEDHGFVEPSSWTDEYKRILELFNRELK